MAVPKAVALTALTSMLLKYIKARRFFRKKLPFMLNNLVTTKYPPASPKTIENIESTGSIIVQATKRGTTRYLTGSTAMTSSASICSVTFIVPSSAVMEAPILPAITKAGTTNPNSLIIVTLTKPPIVPSAESARS